MTHNVVIIFAIAASYVALLALLLVVIRYSRLHWSIKTALSGIITVFYVVHYMTLKQMPGWPSNDRLPDQFRLIAVQIYEPNPILQSQGSIYLWVSDMDQNIGLTMPRAYHIPYNNDMHKRINNALNRMKSGKPQMGVKGNPKNLTGKIERDKSQTSLAVDTLIFYDLPSRLLPEK